MKFTCAIHQYVVVFKCESGTRWSVCIEEYSGIVNLSFLESPSLSYFESNVGVLFNGVQDLFTVTFGIPGSVRTHDVELRLSQSRQPLEFELCLQKGRLFTKPNVPVRYQALLWRLCAFHMKQYEDDPVVGVWIRRVLGSGSFGEMLSRISAMKVFVKQEDVDAVRTCVVEKMLKPLGLKVYGDNVFPVVSCVNACVTVVSYKFHREVAYDVHGTESYAVGRCRLPAFRVIRVLMAELGSTIQKAYVHSRYGLSETTVRWEEGEHMCFFALHT